MEKLEVEASQLASRATEFNAIVAPLERLSGALNGRGRSDCIRAFDENAEGFELCAGQALSTSMRRGYASPLGLLVRMVRDGQHRIPAASENGARPPCPVCGTGGGQHVDGCPLATQQPAVADSAGEAAPEAGAGEGGQACDN